MKNSPDDRQFGRLIRDWRDEWDDDADLRAQYGHVVEMIYARLRDLFDTTPAVAGRFASFYDFRDFANEQHAGLFFDEKEGHAERSCEGEIEAANAKIGHWRELISEAIERGRPADKDEWTVKCEAAEARAVLFEDKLNGLRDPVAKGVRFSSFVSNEGNWSSAEQRRLVHRRIKNGRAVSLADALLHLTEEAVFRPVKGYTPTERMLESLCAKMVAGEFVAMARVDDVLAEPRMIDPVEWENVRLPTAAEDANASEDRNPGGFIIEPTALRSKLGSERWYLDVHIYGKGHFDRSSKHSAFEFRLLDFNALMKEFANENAVWDRSEVERRLKDEADVQLTGGDRLENSPRNQYGEEKATKVGSPPLLWHLLTETFLRDSGMTFDSSKPNQTLAGEIFDVIARCHPYLSKSSTWSDRDRSTSEERKRMREEGGKIIKRTLERIGN